MGDLDYDLNPVSNMIPKRKWSITFDNESTINTTNLK